MKAVILAGGFGSRLSEETGQKPKPMVEIGGKPIIWHIMKIYESHNVTDFIICCGYKGYILKEYFSNYFMHMSDITVDLKNNNIEIHNKRAEPWRITLVDTGPQTMTGGRLLRVKDFLKDEEDFCLTYGDGVGDINVTELINFHRKHGKLATLTSVYPPGRFGAVEINDGTVTEFQEKPLGDSGQINGGFFVLNRKVFDLIQNDQTVWEKEPLMELASQRELMAFEHAGFWQPMDTLRDKIYLENLWNSNQAPWKMWAS